LLGCPISRSLTTSCVCLELRPLPSTGITRLQRYCEPLRHPRAPGLSLTGVRLIIPDHAQGLPVLRALSWCTCCRHYPGAAAGRSLRSSHPTVSAFPGRGRRVGLHIDLFEACSAFTRVAACTLARSPLRDPLSEGFRHFVASMPAPVASGWSDSPGGACTHWKAPPCHGAPPFRPLRGPAGPFQMGIERDEGTSLPIEPHVLKPPAVENAVDDQVEALDARPPAGRSLTRAKPPARSSERSYHPTRDPKPLGKMDSRGNWGGRLPERQARDGDALQHGFAGATVKPWR
jgi:hypothetical protein